jgi:predicted nucleic acid-binding protein
MASSSAEKLVLADVSASVIEQATELRAAHGFRTPDAIHLATALLEGAEVFLTGDAGLARCPGLKVEVLTPEP